MAALNAMRQNGVHMVAVCDVDRPNAEFAANIVKTAKQGGSPDCTDAQVSVVRRNLRIADVALGVGAAALVGAVGVMWLGPSRAEPRAEVVPLAGGALLRLSGRFGGQSAW